MIHVLIAGPDAAMSKALCLLLKREISPVKITEVRDVAGLIRALTENTPDILLLDWKLYGCPATDMYRLLRKAYPDLKVILMGANAEHNIAASVVGADFVEPSITPGDWIAMFHGLLVPACC
jgi:DNA-binding NtrC family response regulator